MRAKRFDGPILMAVKADRIKECAVWGHCFVGCCISYMVIKLVD